MLITIALRNILRNKRRAILTSVTIAVGLGVFIYMQSMLGGMRQNGVDNIIRLTDSPIKLQTKKYAEDKDAYPLKFGVEGYGEMKSYIASIENVSGVSRRTKFLGELMSYDNGENMNVQGVVVDKSSDDSVFDVQKYLTTNSKYFSSTAEYEVIIGSALAKDLDVTVGSYVMLSANTAGGMLSADDFLVVGIFNSPSRDLNNAALYITYGSANSFLDLDGLVTEVNVQLDKPKGMNFLEYRSVAKVVYEKIHAKYSSFEVVSLEETIADFLAMMQQEESFSYVFYVAILLIAGVGIVNSVLMSVYERVREVGVLRAMGFSPEEVVAMFTLEGMIVGLFGSFVGIAIGALFNIQLVYYGLDFSWALDMNDVEGIPFSGVIYGEWSAPTFIFAISFGVVVSLISSVIPARRAGNMAVTKALRFE